MNGLLRRPLEKIRDRLVEALADPPAAAAEEGPTTCPHPADKRIDAARMGHPHAYVCGECLEEVD